MRMRDIPKLAYVKLAYVGAMLAIAATGTINLAAKVTPDVALDGVEAPAEPPILSLAGVRSEAYQRDLNAWFEQRWGLRGYAVRTDNTLMQRLFAETRSVTFSSPVVAKGGVLDIEEDITYVNRFDPAAAQIAAAARIARVQKKLRERGNILVPVIIPAKTSFFRDEVPPGRRRRGAFGLSDVNVYGAFVQTLADNGARFVDGRRLLTEEHWTPERVFAPTGRHWRMAPACRVLQAALDIARPDLPDLGTEQIDCTTTIDPDPPASSEDFDLFRLLNVWGARPAGMNVEKLHPKKTPPGLQVPTLFVGSSFVWKFVRISNELENLRPSLYYYYDSSVVDTVTMLITKKVEPFTDAWREDTFSKKLIVVGILETYIPGDGEKFFLELEKELAIEPPAP